MFLSSWYPSEENPVAGIFVKEHAKAVALYNDVTVISLYDGSRFQKSLYEVSENIEEGIKTIRLKHKISPIPKTSYFIYIWSILSYFRKMIKQGYRPDIIHAHVYTAGVTAVILGSLYKIPVVITEHYTNIATHSLKLREKINLRFAMNKAQIILPVSQDLEEAIKSYRVKNRFRVVPNVVNTDMFYFSKSFDIQDNKKRILSVCILTPRKGISYLLKSLSQLKQKRQDFVLDIVGDGPNRKEYEDLTKNLGLDEIVKFHGRQPEVVTFMRSCDFFVLPSLYENFGVVYIEAIACGKPVIATNAGGPKEFVNKEVGILVLPKDVTALTEAIDYMLDHYQDYSSKKISQYAKENFGYEAVGEKVTSIYKNIMQNYYKKYSVGLSGYKVKIRGDWKVLDVGSGHNPHPRANVLLDKNIYDNTDRSGKSIKIDNERLFFEGNAESMPFKDKEFDYLIASHVAEHCDNPEKFCRELVRVSKGGYIETPSKFAELLFDEPYHKWYVYVKNGILIFEKINIRVRLGLIGKLFYAVYYINIEREGKRTIILTNKCLRYVTSNVVHYLLKKPLLLSGILYTRFEWKESFRFKILEEKNDDRA